MPRLSALIDRLYSSPIRHPSDAPSATIHIGAGWRGSSLCRLPRNLSDRLLRDRDPRPAVRCPVLRGLSPRGVPLTPTVWNPIDFPTLPLPKSLTIPLLSANPIACACTSPHEKSLLGTHMGSHHRRRTPHGKPQHPSCTIAFSLHLPFLCLINKLLPVCVLGHLFFTRHTSPFSLPPLPFLYTPFLPSLIWSLAYTAIQTH
jgi:hypothetical protein